MEGGAVERRVNSSDRFTETYVKCRSRGVAASNQVAMSE